MRPDYTSPLRQGLTEEQMLDNMLAGGDWHPTPGNDAGDGNGEWLASNSDGTAFCRAMGGRPIQKATHLKTLCFGFQTADEAQSFARVCFGHGGRAVRK